MNNANIHKNYELYFDNFTNNIKMLKEKNKFSLNKIAQESGLNIDTVKSYFRKKQPPKPDMETALRMAHCFGVSLDWLVGNHFAVTDKFEQTPEVLLNNLCTVIENTNLKVSIDSKTVAFHTDNKYIHLFCSEIKDYGDKKHIDTVIGEYKNLCISQDGELYSPAELETFNKKVKESQFIYSDIDERIVSEFPDEMRETITERKREWEHMKENKKK